MWVNSSIQGVFARLTPVTNPAVDSLFLFTGRPFDQDSQLQNNLNRWYDTRVGRWLNEDPVGFAAGDGNLYRYVGNEPETTLDFLGTLVVCCRRMQTATLLDYFIDHCQLRNVCVPGERSWPVWVDRSSRRRLDDCTPCSKVSDSDVEECLRRNPHSDQPRGGQPWIGNNCQVGTMLRIGRCCLSTTWKPQLVAGPWRGKCLRYEKRLLLILGSAPVYQTVCVEWELPAWYSNRPVVSPSLPVCPPIDDQTHGGWPPGMQPPGVIYPPIYQQR